jgi:hypothetical protein
VSVGSEIPLAAQFLAVRASSSTSMICCTASFSRSTSMWAGSPAVPCLATVSPHLRQTVLWTARASESDVRSYQSSLSLSKLVMPAWNDNVLPSQARAFAKFAVALLVVNWVAQDIGKVFSGNTRFRCLAVFNRN